MSQVHRASKWTMNVYQFSSSQILCPFGSAGYFLKTVDSNSVGGVGRVYDSAFLTSSQEKLTLLVHYTLNSKALVHDHRMPEF